MPLLGPIFQLINKQIRFRELNQKYQFFYFTKKKQHECNSNSTFWRLSNEHFNDQCSHHIETRLLICRANQLTGFYMMGTLVDKRLKTARRFDEPIFSGRQ